MKNRNAQDHVLKVFKKEWLSIPFVPPAKWEKRIGYPGQGRFVSVFWDHENYECIIFDGANHYTGDRRLWLNWTMDNPDVFLYIGCYTLGDLFRHATHCLLIDRLTRKSYIAKLGMVIYSPLAPKKAIRGNEPKSGRINTDPLSVKSQKHTII